MKDIRLMFNCFKKQNINFVEILFTEYKVMNPKYEVALQKLLVMSEAIAKYDRVRLLKCIKGQVKNEESRVFKETPGTEENMKKYGCDVKSVSHILRYEAFYDDFFNKNLCYKNCLKPANKDEIMRFKTGDFQAFEIHQILDRVPNFYAVLDKTASELIVDEEFKANIDAALDDILLEMFSIMLNYHS